MDGRCVTVSHMTMLPQHNMVRDWPIEGLRNLTVGNREAMFAIAVALFCAMAAVCFPALSRIPDEPGDRHEDEDV